MLTGRKFLMLALVVGLCALTTTGCKRRRSGSTTINKQGIFTTDNFPGDSVQDGNVSDDKRGFSTGTNDYNGGTLVCTHNGDRGTIMVTYQVSDQLFASYYDGRHWTRGVALRHFDADPSTIEATEVVAAFINTANDDRTDARDRDGDCMIFWNASDLDSDGGAGVDDPNQVEFMSYFDVSHADEETLNHGFDIDPSDPGFFEANRLQIDDDAGEDAEFQVLVTDGLCGEARWVDGGNVYSYGNDTSAIFIAWRQSTEKSVGVFDSVTDVVGFNLAGVVDEEFPLVGTADSEVVISTFGASDAGATSQETAVGDEYCSYNFLLQYRVISNDSTTFSDVPTTSGFPVGLPPPGTDTDITMQSTFFDPSTLTQNNEVLNDYIPNSNTSTLPADDMNSDFTRENNYGGFLSATGSVTFGRDEGLSCFVTFFLEEVDSDNTDGVGFGGDDLAGISNECHVEIAEVDEVTGNYLNSAENPQVDFEDGTISDNVNGGAWTHAALSRNGDYLWLTYSKPNSIGTFNDNNPELVEYVTTRLDNDGNPVAIAPLTTSLGAPFQFDPIDQGSIDFWNMFQSNLGYICGQQSDPLRMHFFFMINNGSTSDDEIFTATMKSSVDGTLETVTGASLLIDEDNAGFFFAINPSIGNYGLDLNAFNATDAGQDGDIFYAFLFDDISVDGISDVFLAAGRFGVTASAPIRVDSGVSYRQDELGGSQQLLMISTPPGQDIGQFNLGDGNYDSGADHGPSRIHLVFREAETNSTPVSTGGNTTTGYALRTREYRTDDPSGTFGDDFIPNAGTAFAKPFDLDLPFLDPNTGDDAELVGFQVCDDSVAIEFAEAGHVYYQEFNANSNDNVGWRVSSDDVSDPALIDDDGGELINGEVDICSFSCTCCDLDGTAIFWVKALNVTGGDIDRLQVRILNRGN